MVDLSSLGAFALLAALQGPGPSTGDPFPEADPIALVNGVEANVGDRVLVPVVGVDEELNLICGEAPE